MAFHGTANFFPESTDRVNAACWANRFPPLNLTIAEQIRFRGDIVGRLMLLQPPNLFCGVYLAQIANASESELLGLMSIGIAATNKWQSEDRQMNQKSCEQAGFHPAHSTTPPRFWQKHLRPSSVAHSQLFFPNRS
jgi:hypothetical protein